MKKTIYLPNTSFKLKGNLVQNQKKLLEDYNNKSKIFNNSYIIHDGPPYANGNIHLGHALNKILKDIFAKYNATNIIPGWDTLGLPIELAVEKNNISKTSPYFQKECKKLAEKNITLQEKDFKKLGLDLDYDNKYKTYELVPKTQQVFLDLYEKGYIYKDLKPVHWCLDCESSLAEAEVEYKEKVDIAAYAKFLVKDLPNTYLLAYTTTPWTLVHNKAICLKPDSNYAIVQNGNYNYIVHEDLVTKVFSNTAFNILRVMKTSELLGYKYFTYFNTVQAEGIIVADKEASSELGTGLIHLAPNHGYVDYQICKANNIGFITDSYLDTKGYYKNGIHIFNTTKVLEFLESLNPDCIYKEETIRHSYPHCWRHKTPLITLATEQYFLDLDHLDLRKRCIEFTKEVDWGSESNRNKIISYLQNRPDWCLSRQRVWGTPIPLNETNDVLDVWFDSGCTFSTVLNNVTSNLVIEGGDQYRGWFQSSFILSIALNNKVPFEKVITHGFIVDENNEKYSKSNLAPSIDAILNKYSSDILRLYFSSVDYTKNISICNEKFKTIQDSYQQFRNTLRYCQSVLESFNSESEVNIDLTDNLLCDYFLNTILKPLERSLNKQVIDCNLNTIVTKLLNFCKQDLNNFIDLTKDIIYLNDSNFKLKQEVVYILYLSFELLKKYLFPLIPLTINDLNVNYKYFKSFKFKDSDNPFLTLLDFESNCLRVINEINAKQEIEKSITWLSTEYQVYDEYFKLYISSIEVKYFFKYSNYLVSKQPEDTIKKCKRCYNYYFLNGYLVSEYCKNCV